MREEEPVQITAARPSGRGPSPDYFAHVFIFLGSNIICPLYKLTISDQAQVSLQMRDSLSDFKPVHPYCGAQKPFFSGVRAHSRRSCKNVQWNSFDFL
jgi:hypothetical protein